MMSSDPQPQTEVAAGQGQRQRQRQPSPLALAPALVVEEIDGISLSPIPTSPSPTPATRKQKRPETRLLPSERKTQKVHAHTRVETSTRFMLANFVEQTEGPEHRPDSLESFKSGDETQRTKVLRTISHERRWSYYFKGIRDIFHSPTPQQSLPSLPFHESSHQKDHREALVYHNFQDRANVPVHVCDFKADSAKYSKSTTKVFIDLCQSKPDDVQVRWIHVSVGKGLFQSTLEDIFLHLGPENVDPKPFVQSGTTEWPYPELDMLTFFNRDRFAEKTDAFNFFSEQAPDDKPCKDLPARMSEDLEWRSEQVNEALDFWKMIKADFAYDLDDCFSLGYVDGPKQSRETLDAGRQKLADHPQFEDASLAVSTLRGFNRNGFLVTFSNTTGIDYLNRDFDKYLRLPDWKYIEYEAISVLRHTMRTFESSGTRRWHQKTPEWLLVYLFTEAAVTPHNMRGGRSAIECVSAYRHIMMKLQEDWKKPWKKGQGPKLMHACQELLEELRGYKDVVSRNLKVMRGMRLDVEKLDTSPNKVLNIEGLETPLNSTMATYNVSSSIRRGVSDESRSTEEEPSRSDESPPPDESMTPASPHPSETMQDRVQWAIKVLKQNESDISQLHSKAETIRDDLLKIVTIEQNDLTILADYQNETMLIFAGVATVFLPLSFFTSYFGMNLSTIRDTDVGENYFWRVYGVVALLLVATFLIFILRRRLWKHLQFDRMLQLAT
ncbi:hypothetical protein F4780DRAFT_766446 [Xylariomycetidae sp. FL0641]|nr:hypothetical protein F4780DRAFT_766446 [Xylariomycetidae sp. FL0641]